MEMQLPECRFRSTSTFRWPPTFVTPDESLTARNYVQLEKLGEGTYATVYKASYPSYRCFAGLGRHPGCR